MNSDYDILWIFGYLAKSWVYKRIRQVYSLKSLKFSKSNQKVSSSIKGFWPYQFVHEYQCSSSFKFWVSFEENQMVDILLPWRVWGIWDTDPKPFSLTLLTMHNSHISILIFLLTIFSFPIFSTKLKHKSLNLTFHSLVIFSKIGKKMVARKEPNPKIKPSSKIE